MTDAPMTDALPLPLAFPLHGTRLIEASAGTGKTYTLAALYLRLVLGHGGERAFHRPLLPPEILVVTFTEAATQELRERIRDRLAEAARVFAGDQQTDQDPILAALVADYPDASQRQAAAYQLELAAQWMDEAAIHTIHGFCNRMLKQHAFDSGSLFSLELEQDSGDEQYQAACDYWRTVIAAFPDIAAPRLRQAGLDSPQALLKAAAPLLALPQGDETLPEALQTWLDQLAPRHEQERQARTVLAGEFPAFRAWVEETLASGGLNKSSYKADRLPGMFQILARYADGLPVSSKDEETLQRFTTDGLRLTKKGKLPPLQTPDQLREALRIRASQALPRAALLRHAAGWISRRVEKARHQRASISYDDMITRLHGALTRSEQSAHLARVVREQFPVALIDEFQDTDPLQYGIFSTLYQNQPDTGWFMIGDPKQAIYAFRGADVHTYLQARQATAGRHYTLDRNFRSATLMVAAVNQLFEWGSTLANGDVFLLDNRIPFQPVQAQGRKAVLEIDGQAADGLTLWLDDNGGNPLSSRHYQQRQAQYAAGEIARLLNGGEEGRSGFHKDSHLAPLRSRDIAVLVRDRNEAAAIRQALAERHIRSVYLSDQDSVFATPEALDLLMLLRACAHPEDDRLVHSALACTALARSYAELDELCQDEVRWEAQLDRFHRYHELWQRQGVLPMLRTLLLDFQVPQRLSGSLDSERSLTNLLHLAELLQRAAVRLDGEPALIRWLEEALENGGGNDEDALLRLESDDDRVRVITIHKSKGLEYPLVFLPFICGFKPQVKSKPPLRYHHDGELRIELEPDDDAEQAADHERLAEDMRLLYVALTRAQHACWLGLAPYARGNSKTNQLAQSAIGRLLFGGSGVANDALGMMLAPLTSAAIRILPPPTDNDACFHPVAHAQQQRPVARINRTPATPWWIASYSALRTVQQELAPASARNDQLAEDLPHDTGQDATPVPTTGIHAFPRGPLPGTLLHEMLERAARDGFAATLAHPAELDRLLAEQLAARRWQEHEGTVRQWWRDTLNAPLPLGPGDPVTLAGLDNALPEMEFLFPAENVSVARLDQLIRHHIAPDHPRPHLEQDTLNGMLKGFMDLVFEHQGRYYVLDYKSNWLGPDSDAYSHEAIRDAVLKSRYEVQYSLYLLALHRLLRSRLGQRYQPQQHLGGAVYVFLRGLDGPAGGCLFDRPDQQLIDSLDQLFVPATEGHHAA